MGRLQNFEIIDMKIVGVIRIWKTFEDKSTRPIICANEDIKSVTNLLESNIGVATLHGLPDDVGAGRDGEWHPCPISLHLPKDYTSSRSGNGWVDGCY